MKALDDFRVTAIKGRERQHVEYRQNYIDEEGIAEVLRDPWCSLNRQRHGREAPRQ
jgi:hypothetical protein